MGNLNTTYFDFVAPYEEKANQLDKTAVSFWKSIDFMNATTEHILLHLESLRQQPGAGNENVSTEQERLCHLMSYLLKTVNDTVQSNKKLMMAQQKQLREYIANVFNNELKSLDKVELSDVLEEYYKSQQFSKGDLNVNQDGHHTGQGFKDELNDIKEPQQSKHPCQIEINRLQDENKALQANVNTLQNENSNLKDQLKHNSVFQHESSMKQIEEIKLEMHQKEQSANETMKIKEEEIKDLKQQLIDHKTTNGELVENNKKKQKLIEQLEKQVTFSEKKRKEIEENLNIAKTNWDKKRTELEDNINQLNTKVKEQEEEKNKCTNEKEKLKKEINELLCENNKLKQDVTNLTSKVEEHESLVSQNSKELEQKRKEIAELMSKKDTLTREIIFFKSKQVVNVQILFNQRTAWTDSVEDTLMSILKSKIDSNTLELRFTQCATSEEVKPEYPVLVVCLVVSRIGTDVDKGIQGLKTTDNTVLVVVHHKDVYALPNQSSDRILQSPEHKRCGGIYDMGYQGNKGFYECGMNATTFISLINFIKEHGVKEPIYSDK